MPDQRNIKRRTVWSKLSATAQSRVWSGIVATLPTATEALHNFVATVPEDGALDRVYRCMRQFDGTFAWIEQGGGIIDTEFFLDFGTREVAFP